MSLNDYSDAVHEVCLEAGWWPGPGCYSNELIGTKVALIHSEVSEMLEGIRKGLPDDHLPDRDMAEVEAADVLIRLFDLAGALNWDLEGAYHAKMAYNATRADHKPEARAADGGKKF